MQLLQAIPVTAMDITGPALLGTYVMLADCELIISLRLSDLVGAGVYTVCTTRERGGVAYQSPTAVAAVSGGCTTLAVDTIPLAVLTGDTVRVYAKGLAGDTAVNGSVDIYDIGVASGLTAQETRDAMKLAPSAGAAIAGSVDDQLATIEAQTDDIGTAGAGLTALGDARLANLDAAVSSRAAAATALSNATWTDAKAAFVDGSILGIPALVWSYATRTLTSLSALVASIAAAVWTYATRTLTQSAASVTATVSGSEITVYRGDTWSISLTGLGAITGYLDVWFTVKDSPTQTDAEALLLASTSVGLEILNGAMGTAGQATLVVDDASAGNITVTVAAAATALIAEGQNRVYDVQWKSAASAIHTLTINTFNVNGDVTRAIT